MQNFQWVSIAIQISLCDKLLDKYLVMGLVSRVQKSLPV